MSSPTAVRRSVVRGVQVAGGFLRMGWLKSLSYPLAFAVSQIQSALELCIYYFIAQLVGQSGPAVGNDYYTFVVIGVLGALILSGGLQDFILELDESIQQGRLEMLLVEPVPWTLLPFGMAQWPIFIRTMNALIMVGLSLLLGAHFRVAGIPMVVPVLLLGLSASLAIGMMAASVKILSKRADPIMTIYTIGSSVLSGVFFPIDVLPKILRDVSVVIPQTHVLSALRKSLLPEGAGITGPSPGKAMIALVLFNVVLYPISFWLLNRSLNYGRKMGLLSGY